MWYIPVRASYRVQRLIKRYSMNALAASLERKAVVFDKLRTAMRIALPEGKNGINDNGDDVDIKSIEEKAMSANDSWIHITC